MGTFTQYRKGSDGTADTDRTPSPNLWATCPWQEIGEGGGGPIWGHKVFDDFLTFEERTGVTSDQHYNDNWTMLADIGVTFSLLADQDHGVLEIAGNDADNDEGHIMCGYKAGWARFNPAGDHVWAEIRFKQASVADNSVSWFFGATEVTNVALGTTLVANTGALDASEDFVGWRTLQADGDVAEPIYQEGDGTLAHVGSGTTNAAGSGNDTTLTAATYIKLGFRYRPDRGDQGRIEYYVNGVLNSWYDIAGSAAWPDTNHMLIGLFTQTGSAVERKVQIDWIRAAAMSE